MNQNKPSGRGLYLPKTDEATQAIAESSSEYVLAFPIKSQPRPPRVLAARQWPGGGFNIVFELVRVSLLLFLADARNEGDGSFSFQCNGLPIQESNLEAASMAAYETRAQQS